ncbi:uncharacterized protein Z518_03453 [Rhinocladiella mackenziei CBS 650.93]|uniref:AB hydrolase-1 domain-containing protein n=1 Tax=Rhinocladiella mackenziei CBS 650.93 TaxID=1442369 RepID=A0A0D2IZE2_9EURO|nr:uncharacterized protein Z518_03453 [Rhinocladiella mackenziei CBS 650.93]KIX08796.1 hypothetical protein Z518_03453 [Rhinocladiella mackenziei CBS 650.93]
MASQTAPSCGPRWWSSFSDLPCRMIVPDLLGYAGTSKPTDISAYNFKGQADDLVEILKAEDISSVIIIGHDWGSVATQRFYLYHPEFVVGVVLMNVSYRPPTEEKFDLEAANELTTKMFGYPQFAYWELFTADDGYQILNEHLESFWAALHGDVDDWMKKMFCVRGAMKNFLLNDKQVPLKAYAMDPKWKNDFMERFTRDGFEAPTCWYKSYRNNIQWESERSIPNERYVIQLPVLFIGCTGDAVCRSDLIQIPKNAGLLPDLEIQEIESGHWCAMEKPNEVAKHVRSFVTKRFP